MQKIIVSAIAAAILALSGSAAWADKPDQLNPDNPVVLRHQMHDWQHRHSGSRRRHHDYHHHRHHHIRRYHHSM